MSTLYTMVAPCFFGTESTLNFEVKRLGAQNIQVTDGRVAFQGGADVIAAANLNLRTAERVLLLLATYKATTFDELFDGCYNIAWEELLPANAAFPVKGSSLSSQLSSVPACQSIVKKAIVKRLMQGHKVSTLPEDGALYKVRFALRKDTVEIYLDTSGDGLHKRGYRKNATLAPIKETLAAAIVDLGRVRRDSLVQDPFCGSGTLVIEAAQKALNLAPACAAALPPNISTLSPPISGPSSDRKLSLRSARMLPLRASATISTPLPWPWPTPTQSWRAWGTAAALKPPMSRTSAPSTVPPS